MLRKILHSVTNTCFNYAIYLFGSLCLWQCSILTGSRFDCLRWSADGLSVVIDGAEEVGSQVLSQYFQTEKISSFIRQFHLYGFKRTTDGRKNKNKRGYSNWVNRYFQRGRPDLLELITRLPPPKSPLKDKSEDNEDDNEEGKSNYKSGAYMSRLRLPMTDPRAPSTYPGLNLNVNVQPNVLLPDNQGIVASPVIVAYSQQPVLAAASSLSPALSAVIESPVSPFAPPPLRPLQQSTFPVDREVNQSVFETPRAVETLYALQTIEDNVDGVHPEASFEPPT
ncbi:Heat shock transcription factor [Coemansia sp. S16]|nr:Heat shock transcription factor [Coemansia sp. S16]